VEWPSEDRIPAPGIRVRLLAHEEGTQAPNPRVSRFEKENRTAAPV